MLLTLALTLAASRALTDTLPTFADRRTEALILEAIQRHEAQDGRVTDYAARFRYRLSFGLGRRRWSRIPNAAVEELEGQVQWATPNDLRVDILGRRAAARDSELSLTSGLERPWFVPRALPDSIRVFGNDLPPRPALHPLSRDGPLWYSYRLTDSVQFVTSDGHRVRLLAIEVLPRRTGGSLVAGRLWLDQESLDVVRITFRFVGEKLWLDSSDEASDDKGARWVNRVANRILTLNADLEYALQDQRYWMPYRQVVSGRVELPWFGELVIPFEATTTFEDYQVNTGRAVVFQLASPDSVEADTGSSADSARSIERRRRRRDPDSGEHGSERDVAGRWNHGRYEIHQAPGDSLAAYRDWGDSLVLADDPIEAGETRLVEADLERLSYDLPAELTGRQTHGLTWDRLTDIFRYNRVQGLAPGLGYRVVLPGDGFTTLQADLRFGLSDHRLVGGLTAVREAPGARWTFAAYRELRSSDPFNRSSFGRSLDAIFAAHDDADYFLATGGRVTREGSAGMGLELVTTLSIDEERSVRRQAHSAVNDALGGSGVFPDNPPVAEGTFLGGSVELQHRLFRSRWTLGAELLANTNHATLRGFASWSSALWRGRVSPRLSVRTGLTSRDPLPQQAFQIGGLESVRGFDYGTRRGAAFWTAQLDWPLTSGLVQPMFFADVGQAAPASQLFSSPTIAGGGAGLSLLGGLLQFDLSHPITSNGAGFRFDISAKGFL